MINFIDGEIGKLLMFAENWKHAQIKLNQHKEKLTIHAVAWRTADPLIQTGRVYQSETSRSAYCLNRSIVGLSDHGQLFLVLIPFPYLF